jgi:2-iminobutanoate/2-iminopropanoate deaminase
MDDSVVYPGGAAPPSGSYSPAVKVGNLMFVSGQVPKDPATGQIIDSRDLSDHVRRVMDNIQILLDAAGASMDDIVKCTVYLKDIGGFARYDQAYRAYFKTRFPARTTVQCERFMDSRLVEIDAVVQLRSPD